MFEPDFAEIGSNIRKKRIEQHLTQENLADAVDVNVSHISNIETNKVKISLSLLIKICKSLNTTVDYILSSEFPEMNSPLEKEINMTIKKLPREKQEQILRIAKVI